MQKTMHKVVFFFVFLHNYALFFVITEREKVEERIRNERVCVWYLKCINYLSYGYDSNEYDSFIDKFSEEAIALGVLRVSEKVSMQSFLDTLK